MKTKQSSIIQQLMAKRDEIDRAIETIRGLESSGILSNLSFGHLNGSGKRFGSKSGLSVYQGTVALLRSSKKPMTMREISDAIIASGKNINSKNPASIISTTIYKSVKSKKNCELVKFKNGTWGLKEWQKK